MNDSDATKKRRGHHGEKHLMIKRNIHTHHLHQSPFKSSTQSFRLWKVTKAPLENQPVDAFTSSPLYYSYTPHHQFILCKLTWLEKLAVSSPNTANIDKYAMRRIQDFLSPILWRQGDYIGWKWISCLGWSNKGHHQPKKQEEASGWLPSKGLWPHLWEVSFGPINM